MKSLKPSVKHVNLNIISRSSGGRVCIGLCESLREINYEKSWKLTGRFGLTCYKVRDLALL